MATPQAFDAFVLHRRPWRESSLLLELFTLEQGRIGVVVRGAASKRTPWRNCLQGFRPLRVFLSGRGELATLTHAEETQAWPPLTGERLYCGLYLNELVVRLLPRQDPQPELFQSYRDSLHSLPQVAFPGVPLRYFELDLLAALGFGLQLEYEADSGQQVDAQSFYRYDIEAGPRRSVAAQAYAGDSLLALSERRLEAVRQRADARRLLQQALAPHLGSRPLVSRQLMKRKGG